MAPDGGSSRVASVSMPFESATRRSSRSPARVVTLLETRGNRNSGWPAATDISGATTRTSTQGMFPSAPAAAGVSVIVSCGIGAAPVAAHAARGAKKGVAASAQAAWAEHTAPSGRTRCVARMRSGSSQMPVEIGPRRVEYGIPGAFFEQEVDFVRNHQHVHGDFLAAQHGGQRGGLLDVHDGVG